MEKIIASEVPPNGLDSEILTHLSENSADLNIESAIVYYGFPVFKKRL
jgi:hypothetical protein